MKFRVYYMHPDHFRRLCGLHEPVELARLAETHVFLREIVADDLESVYIMQQGERWSPNGEARALIRSKGLQHTSMSIGDVIENEAGEFHSVAMMGFTKL